MRPFLISALAVSLFFGQAENCRTRERQLLNADWRFTLEDARGAETGEGHDLHKGE
jgi:hypothetical protein